VSHARNPIRLLGEVLLIVAATQVVVMLALSFAGAEQTTATKVAVSAALLVLLAGPTVYWRCMAHSHAAPTPRRKQDSRNGTVGAAIAMTAAAQALGLVLTGACVVWQQRSIAAAAQERFDRSAERIENEVKRHFTLPLYGLNGLRGMFAADERVTRSQFRAWIESRNLPVEFPGVRGLGFIERVKREDLVPFVNAQRSDGERE
jgi:hypothetical protein